LRRNLQSELTPAHLKGPKNWPKKMQEKWGSDEGMAFATPPGVAMISVRPWWKLSKRVPGARLSSVHPAGPMHH